MESITRNYLRVREAVKHLSRAQTSPRLSRGQTGPRLMRGQTRPRLMRGQTRPRLMRGQTMTEYALILAAIAIAVFVTYQTMGNNIDTLAQQIDAKLSAAAS
jgi:Flp pilus assembly pilin Flp